jgi:hypothetical protein
MVNVCTLLDLTEESEFPAWDALMGHDSVHLTGDGYAKLASGIVRMAEGPDAVFSGGKRGHEAEDGRPAPTIGGRNAWIYTSASGQSRGGGHGNRVVGEVAPREGDRLPDGMVVDLADATEREGN